MRPSSKEQLLRERWTYVSDPTCGHHGDEGSNSKASNHGKTQQARSCRAQSTDALKVNCDVKFGDSKEPIDATAIE